MQSFLDEVIIMHRFRHQNVLAMLGLSVVDDKPYAVLPFMDNGDLKSYIQDSDKVSAVLQVKLEDYLKEQNYDFMLSVECLYFGP